MLSRYSARSNESQRERKRLALVGHTLKWLEPRNSMQFSACGCYAIWHCSEDEFPAYALVREPDTWRPLGRFQNLEFAQKACERDGRKPHG